MTNFRNYTASELLELLNTADECNWLEAKGKEDVRVQGQSNKENFRTLLESVCSFSNEPDLGGGIILYGIGENEDIDNDERYVVEGVDNLDKAQLDIATQCKECFNIPVYPEIKVENIAGRKMLRIVVHELPETKKPLYFKKNGLPAGAYRRIGSADLKCTEEDLYVFYQNTARSYDQTPVDGAYLEDIDQVAIERYRTLRAKVNPTAEELNYSDQELLEALGCVVHDNPRKLNLAGVLMFGSYKLQRRVIPTMRVDYIRVPGNEWVSSPDESFHSIDMLGPLMLLVFRLVDAVNADLPKGFALKEGELQAESRGLPPMVLREAIVNSLMHRSYRVDRPTQIIRYDNRIEIINAGYSLKDEETFNRPGSALRNKIIAPIFHDTNLAETKGSGIKRMRDLMQQAQMVLPTMESNRSDNSFTLRLLLHHLLDARDIEWLNHFSVYELNEHQKTALVFLRETGAVDNLTYRQMNNSEILKASRELRAMRDMGLLESKGKGSATYYIPGQLFIETARNAVESLDESTEALNTHGGAEASHDDRLIYQGEANETSHGDGLNTHGDGPNTHGVIISNNEMPGTLLCLSEEIKNQIETLGRRSNNKENIRRLILELCRITPMTKKHLAVLLKRREDYLKQKFLVPMLADKSLRYLHPEMIKHPKQAYMANQTDKNDNGTKQ